MHKIKSIFLHIKKLQNPLLLASAVILLFVHHLYTDSSGRIAWYLRDICGKTSYLFSTIVFYRLRVKMQYDLLEKLFNKFFFSLFAILTAQIIDDIIAFVFNKHWHNYFLVMQSISVLAVIFYWGVKYERASDNTDDK